MRDSKKLFKDVAISIGLLAVYFVAGKMGLRLAFVNASATAVWPPTGIALAALLILGYRFWPVILLGAFLVNFTTAGGIATSVGIALGNTLEAVFGAYLVNRFAAGRKAFESPGNIFKFTLLEAILATPLSATIGVTTLILGGLATMPQFNSIWLTWWLGDFSGALIVAPLFLIWSAKKPLRWDRRQILEAVIYALVFIFACQTIFGPLSVLGTQHYPLEFLCLPVLMWAAIRFGKRETATIVVIFSGITVWATLHGLGPFFWGDQNISLLLLQAFLSVTSLTTLVVSSLITRQKELENNLIGYTQELAEEKATAEAVVASIGEGLIVADGDGNIRMVNKRTEEMLGFGVSELLDKSVIIKLKMEDELGKQLPEGKRPLILAFSSGKKITGNYYIVRKDGSRFPALVTATPLVLGGKVIGGVKIFHDITKETAVDKAKTEFVSLASHQLRTPLTITKWQSASLLEEFKKTKGAPDLEKSKKYAEKIYLSNQRMIDLVNAILNVSKIDLGSLAVEPEPSSLKEITEKLLEEFEQDISIKKLKLAKSYPAKDSLVEIDPKLFRMILQNLLTNAIKYTGPEGRVSLKIELKNSDVLLTVADDGCGILPADQDKIFNKFFRTAFAKQIDPNGNGLGMYVVKAIVNQVKGKIWFESKVDKGTVFYVKLPLSGMAPRPGVEGLNEVNS